MNKLLLFVLLLLIGLGCSSPNLIVSKETQSSFQTDSSHLQKPIVFEKLKSMYDTLIPIMDGLFVTYDSFDLYSYDKMMTKFYPKIKTREDTVRALIHRFEYGLDGFTPYSK